MQNLKSLIGITIGALVSTILATTPITANAATLRVPSQYSTIQEAMDSTSTA